MTNQIVCPTDFVTVNETRVRITAGFVFILSVIYLLTGFWPVITLLVYDFAVRAFNYNNYSLLSIISGVLVKQLSLPHKPVDRAPKRFAARIGLIMNIAILIFHFAGYSKVAISFSGMIVLFSFLESVFAFCAGCYIYTFWKQMQNRVTAAA